MDHASESKCMESKMKIRVHNDTFFVISENNAGVTIQII